MKTTDAVHLKKLRDEMIVEFLTNAIECILDGDGLSERDRSVLQEAFRRVAAKSFLNDAERQEYAQRQEQTTKK